MKTKRTRLVPHRRRREGRTDYHQRMSLLLSKKPRLVVRKSNQNLTCQIVQYDSKGDHTIVTVNATQLRTLGWKGNLGSIPAAYLIGYLCGTLAKKKKVATAVADLGLHTSSKWSRVYAAIKGAVDAGLDVPHSKDILPPQDRAMGKHISAYAEKLKKESPAAYEKMFSGYLKAKLPPEQLSGHVEEIKKKIV